ncbi:MAG: flagellar hook-associated family protein [Rhizobiaceae bacterium]
MKISHVSTLSLSQSLRHSISRMQSEMASTQKMVATGRVDDSGLALGAGSSRLISLRGDQNRILAIIDTNHMAITRMSASQDAIGQVIVRAQDILESMASGMSQNTDPAIVVQSAKAALGDTLNVLNTSLHGDFIFSGINSDSRAVADYETGPAKAAFDAAFLGFFGFTKNDPAAELIDEPTMRTFLDTVVEPLFLGAGWNTNISAASDEGILSRITLSQTAVTSVSANESGFRKTVMATVIVSELFDGNLSANALNAVADKSTELSGEAVADLSELQGRTGLVEEQLDRANSRLQSQADLLEGYADSLEAIDPYEASTRLTSLLTQIETSYALTARIQQLSLMRFMV